MTVWVQKYVQLVDDYGPFQKGQIVFCTADLPEETGHDVFCVMHEGLLYNFQPHKESKEHFRLIEKEEKST